MNIQDFQCVKRFDRSFRDVRFDFFVEDVRDSFVQHNNDPNHEHE